MAREFDRNIFIMLFAIMIGIIIITYFVADIVNRSKIEDLTTQYEGEITTVIVQSENFTSHFLRSSVILDQAREDRAFGNYHFDLAFLWYQSALSETNSTLMGLYKVRGTDNCTNALPYYFNSNLNFKDAEGFFNDTKQYSEIKHLEILDLYTKLTDSGAKLSKLRYSASQYLMYIIENLTFNVENNNVTYLGNVSGLIVLFEEAMESYAGELGTYEELQEEIDEYEFFEEER